MLDAGFYNMDCMDGMKEFPDSFFDLAIVDPPYKGVTRGGYMINNQTTGRLCAAKNYHTALWQQRPPTQEYFDELFRVSKNQVIWGGNYFQTMIQKDSQCWIVWDKMNGDSKFADCELAWTSFNRATRIFRFRWAGMLQEHMGDLKENRIHPTQKPVALYQWILVHFAEPGMKILDTHVGSGSSLIACARMGFEAWGFEIDEQYYKLAAERIARELSQGTLF